MKPDLLEKYNQLTHQSFVDFKSAFTKNMPAAPDRHDVDPVSWGTWPCRSAVWQAKKDHIVLFESNGSVHTIGSKYDASYFQSYSILASTVTGCRTLVPTICEELTLDASEHPSGKPAGSTIYYLKFDSPGNEFGMPNMFRYHTLKEVPEKQQVVDYIDRCFEILTALKSSNILLPEKLIKFNHFYQDTYGVYMGLCPDFKLTTEEAIPMYIDEIETSAVNSPVMSPLPINELIAYVREKWGLLKN